MNKTMNPKATVVITAFNTRPHLRAAIESALRQTLAPVQVVVIDDGSTDGSLDIIKEFEGRIEWETGPNRGGNHARNRGLRLAKGPYCQFLDGDDVMDGDKLEKQIALLEARPDASFVVGVARIWRADSNKLLPDDLWGPPGEADVIAEWLKGTVAQTNTMLWRTDFLRSINGWNEGYPSHQDNEVALRGLMAGGKAIIDPEPRSTWRKWSATSVSSDPRTRSCHTWIQLTEEFNSWAKSQPGLRDKYAEGIEESVWSVIRPLAEESPRVGHEVIRAAEKDGRLGRNHWRWGGLYGRTARHVGFKIANGFRQFNQDRFSGVPEIRAFPARVAAPASRVRVYEPGTISVVVPMYNRAGLIGFTLRSLLHQTRPAREIFLVDDGSTDNTVREVEREFEVFRHGSKGRAAVPRLKIICQKNSGPGAARNMGLREATGEFVHFFDSDDIAALNKHEVQVGTLEKTGADVAFGPWVKGRIVEQGAWRAERGARSMEQGSEAKKKRYSFEPENVVLQQGGLPEGDLIRELLVRWSIVPQTCVFRHVALDQVGEYPEDLVFTEDQELFLRCLLAGCKVVHTPDTLTFYRTDNTDKLTSDPERAKSRHDNWARLLLRMRTDCLLSGVDPLNWFGFRMRCEGALQSLEKAGGRDLPAAKQLRRYRTPSRVVYQAISSLSQWTGGASTRIGGHRWNASFRCAPITPKQLAAFPGGV